MSRDRSKLHTCVIQGISVIDMKVVVRRWDVKYVAWKMVWGVFLTAYTNPSVTEKPPGSWTYLVQPYDMQYDVKDSQ